MRITHALAAVVVGLSLALTGCGDDEDTDNAGQTFNDADVTFAQEMIPHHQQAVMMASLAKDRAKDPDVADLARQILRAQEPEIQTMQGWLEDWDAEVSHVDGGHGDMAHDETGMMSQRDISRLTTASGRAFDRLFLRFMIEHHEGAIEMARTERSGGTNEDAIALAERIESAQAGEIERMRSLLAGR